MAEFWSSWWGELIKIFGLPFFFALYKRACELSDNRKARAIIEQQQKSDNSTALTSAEIAAASADDDRAFEMMKLLIITQQKEIEDGKKGGELLHKCDTDLAILRVESRHEILALQREIDNRDWFESRWIEGKMSDQEFRELVLRRQAEINSRPTVDKTTGKQ